MSFLWELWAESELEENKIDDIFKTDKQFRQFEYQYNTEIEIVAIYKYLGACVIENGDQAKEIRSRIEIVENAFLRLSLNIEIPTGMLYDVMSSLHYYIASNCGQDNKTETKKLNSFEMWCYGLISGLVHKI